ncbi:MAG: hypothetical protein WC803_05200 [Sphingomonas sp.]
MRQVLIELLHIALGVGTVALMARAAAWAVPLAAREIMIVGFVSVAFIIGMGVKPLLVSLAEHRRRGEQ